MGRARIIGTGAYVPEKIITNADLEKMVDTSDDWIVERTGIRERRQAAPGEVTSDMAVAAARQALEMAELKPEDIDHIIVGTITADRPMPSCACYVQAKLGAFDAAAFDISAACAGSLYGLHLADSLLRSGAAKRILVIGVELLTRIVDWEDRNTCILFGDAAGAMVLTMGDDPERGILESSVKADGRQAEILTIPGGGSERPMDEAAVRDKANFVSMQGREVFKFAVRKLSDGLMELFERQGIKGSDVDHLVAHQANLRIVEAVLSRVGIPQERCWVNLDRFGNTSSASLPITLDEVNRAGKLKKGDLIAMMSIGGGMAWGTGLVRW